MKKEKIKKIIREEISKLIKENPTSTYEYGCAMVYFDFPEINKIHDAINPDHIYEEDGDKTFGLEDEPHTTLLFGLHPDEVSVDQIKETIEDITFSACKIHNASLFENECDILKFDVSGGGLREANSKLSTLPHTTSYPDYHPHLTIGYVKKGLGKKYVKMLKGHEYQLMPQYVVYSEPDGTKTKINIRIDS